MTSHDPGEEENQLTSGGANTIALSLFIIVLAFFIFTVAISTPDNNKKTSLLASVERTFGGLSMAERKTESRKNQKPVTGKPVDFSPIITGDSDLSRYAEIRLDYEYSALIIPSDFFFKGQDTKIRREAMDSLEKIADLIRGGGYSAEIIGYPSLQNARESRISALRAMAIAHHFFEKDRIAMNRLSAFSWTGRRAPEDTKPDIDGNTSDFIEIVFKSGNAVEEDSSLKFKDFIFKVMD